MLSKSASGLSTVLSARANVAEDDDNGTNQAASNKWQVGAVLSRNALTSSDERLQGETRRLVSSDSATSGGSQNFRRLFPGNDVQASRGCAFAPVQKNVETLT